MTISILNYSLRSLQYSLALVLFLFSVSHPITAQSAIDAFTPPGQAPGAPSGSFPLSDFENINLFNGHLNFHLPLLKVGGRGAAGYMATLPIEQRWTVRHESFSNSHFPVFEWWSGLHPGYGPGVLQGRQMSEGCSEGYYLTEGTTRLTFTASDGTEYELRDQIYGGVGASSFCDPYNPGGPGASRGTVFVTADGTAATFTSDTTIYDRTYAPSGPYLLMPSGYLMLRDGTRYRIDGGMVTWMRDRNGNKVTFTYIGSYTDQAISSATDSLNRQVSFEYGVSDPPYGTCNRIRFKGFGGVERIVRITRTTLSNALISGESIATYANLFPNLTSSPSAYFDPYIVSAVWLPDQRSYQFRYNRYGELARVELPSGGRFEYSWSEFPQGIGPLPEINRRVTERREYTETGALAGRSTYGNYQSTDGTQGSVQADHFDFNGSLLARDKHYFHGHPFSYTTTDTFALPNPIEGREYQTEVFDSNGTTILRRIAHTWATCATLAGTAINPCVTQTTTTQEPATVNLVSKQTFSYDSYNNQTDVYEYAFGTGAAGGLVRRSHTDYLTTNPVNGANYATNANIHICSLPTQQLIYEGGTEKAKVSYEYDNYAAGGNNAPLTDRYLISGLDAAFNTGYQTRGNLTRGTRWLLATGAQLQTYSQYDIAGSIVKVIDPRNYATTIDFSDRFGTPDGDARLNYGAPQLGSYSSYGFATQVTNALGHSTYSQFDYYTGQAVDVEDVNGFVSSSYFDDLLERPTQVIRAVGTSVVNQATFDYDDVNRVITVTNDRNTFNDGVLKSQTVYDGLGRTSETRQYETTSTYITVKTNYDALGRAYQISNPYRSGETILWTTSSFDALGRVISVTTPDSAVVTTSYSGNQVSVTDQAGKQRKSVTDALGRLVQIYEDPSAGGLNHLTSYTYDVLDNLTGVSQGAQTRTFVYDSLKRLISASNPESGTINYQYDNNGNLTQKTDARLVVSNYAWDALNRNTSVTYSNDPSGTLPITRVYDMASNGKGQLYQSQTTGASGSLTTIDSYDALGRPLVQRQQFYSGGAWSQSYTTQRVYNLASGVTSQTYPSGRTVAYVYDIAGRSSSFTGNLGDGTQRTYATGIIYSPFGGITKEQFGTDTAIFNKSFYNSRGQLSEIRVSTSYTGPADVTWNRGAILNQYSLQCSGPSCNATDNNGNLRKQEVYVPANDQASSWTTWYQQYDYDNLNRLKRVHEYTGNPTVDWQQEYLYDRYGNRRIDTNPAATYGGVNNLAFEIEADSPNNRLYSPGDLALTEVQRRMQYDAAGNLKRDTYTGAGDRVYDAETRMTKAWANGQWQEYLYDADGHRIKRKVNGTETWQVYGIGGELLAEYATNGNPAAPEREYGYRNGELLITTSAAVGWGTPPDFETNAVAIGVIVRSIHITELRNAINALRAHLNLPAYAWQYSATTSDWISANPILEMRIALDQALGPPAFPGYAAGLASGQPIKAVHLQELQERILAAWNSGSSAQINWLVTDHLGTPRMIIDKTGSLAAVKRHDYLPFGEELTTQGLRSTTLGYSADAIRQKFTSKERDNETGLDYFLARYYSSPQGRFTSPDEFKGGPEELFGEVDPHDPLFYADTAEPQSLNKYHYALNNPLRYIDPDGHQTTTADKIKQAAGSVAGFVTSAWKGEAKSVANVVIGASNIGNGAIGGGQTQPYEPNNAGEAYGMRVMDVITVVGSLIGGKGPAGVMVAETKPSTLVAAEVGNAERSSLGAAGTARAARREAMRAENIPTSQQPSNQVSPRGGGGRQYQYQVPKAGGGTETKIVTNQLRDRNHGPHYEAGRPKTPHRTDPGGRLKHSNDKTKVEY